MLTKEGDKFIFFGEFDREHEAFDENSGISITTEAPRLEYKESTLPVVPVKGDTIEIRSKVYEVYDSQTDGQGIGTLFLHETEID